MPNTNFVCFKCQISKRYSSYTSAHRCHACGHQLSFSYYKFRIPTKKDNKGWIDLREKVYSFNSEARIRNSELYKKKIAKIEEIIKSTDQRNKKLIEKLNADIDVLRNHVNRWLNWN